MDEFLYSALSKTPPEVRTTCAMLVSEILNPGDAECYIATAIQGSLSIAKKYVRAKMEMEELMKLLHISTKY